jgi:hypothetical protein
LLLVAGTVNVGAVAGGNSTVTETVALQPLHAVAPIV